MKTILMSGNEAQKYIERWYENGTCNLKITRKGKRIEVSEVTEEK